MPVLRTRLKYATIEVRMKITFVLLTAAVLLASSAQAQSWQGGLHFMIGSPQGEFRKNVDRLGVGLTGNIGYAPEGTPIMLGLEFGFMNYGSTDRREPFSPTIPDVTVKVTTSNNFILGHAVVRLQPNTGMLRPYLQGMLGFNYLTTDTKVVDEDQPDKEIASSTNFSDGAFSYGAGAGVLILVYTPEDLSFSGLFVDLGIKYVYGGEAEYLKEGSIRRVGGAVIYDSMKSRTDLIEFQLGVSVRF
jgi:opacity protein-like surface antigen